MKPLLQAEHITKDYQLGEVTVHALKDVSFEIYEKELIVILGPSGSGKSTTLNILGGIETVTSGSVIYGSLKLNEADPQKLTAYRREHIGFIFQFYNLLPGLTALENIALSAELSNHPLDPGKLLARIHAEARAGGGRTRPCGGAGSGS